MTTENAGEDDLPTEKLHEHLAKAVELLTGRPKHCSRNAIRCLKRAWALRSVDPEMSVFRAITAEEEAATALMFALKHRKYPQADKLRPRDHAHKMAWIPLIEAIGRMLHESGFPQPNIRLETEESARIDVRIAIDALNIPDAPPGHYLSPDEPLNIVVREGQDPKIATFDRHLNEWAEGKGKPGVVKYIDEAANLRNRVLYAEDGGMPSVQHPENLILERRRRVTVLLMATIAVLQADKPQPLGVQALQAFLKLMRNIDDVGFDFEAATAEPAEFRIETMLDAVDGRHRTRIEQQRSFNVAFGYRWGRDW